VIIRYFETLRNMLNTYQNNTAFNNTAGIKDMFNLEAYYELCKSGVSLRLYIDVIQNFVTQPFMRELVTQFSTSIQAEF
jgi:hypothetical protein